VPSDKTSSNGIKGSFRVSSSHAQDIAAAISYLKENYHVPVWIVGTSRGSISAANAAARIDNGGADGLILTSSVTRQNKKGSNLFDVNLQKITLPTLVIHHKNDECKNCPYTSVGRIMHNLKNSSRLEHIAFDGGEYPLSGPCNAKSYHGYLGIEEKVISAIADWL
ncbi:alpha/beta hydrolase, partial [Thermodesulfobacteriota bacterium]